MVVSLMHAKMCVCVCVSRDKQKTFVLACHTSTYHSAV